MGQEAKLAGTRPQAPDQAKTVSGKALDSMERLGVPPYPPNYWVWYGYHQGRDPELTAYLDSLQAEGTGFTEARNEAIFARFFGTDPEDQAVREAGSRLQGMIDELRGKLGSAGESTLAYGDKLAVFSDQLSSAGAPAAIQAVLADLAAETGQVVARNRELEQSLASSSQEIDDLRRNLQEARQEAVTDALTGIANRKFFDSRLQSERERRLQGRSPLCLLLVDIDHFKRFNDTFGHQIGDEVLKVVAMTLKSCVKGRDLPARYGGEEFAVILPDTTLEDGLRVAEQIRGTLASKRLQNKRSGQDYGRLTLSIGAAALRPSEPASALIARADAALYQAKRDGRNLVVSEAAEAQPQRHAG